MAGLPPDAKVDLLILPKPKSFFEQLLDGPQIESRAATLPTGLVPTELTTALRAAAQWQRLFQRPVATVLPFRVEFR